MNQNKPSILFLDDLREFTDVFDFEDYGNYGNVVVVRTFDEFKKAVSDTKFDRYSFDFHLSKEDDWNGITGMHCLIYLLEASGYDWKVDDVPPINFHTSDRYQARKMQEYVHFIEEIAADETSNY